MSILDKLMIVAMILGVYALSSSYTYNVSKRVSHLEQEVLKQ